MLKIHTNLLAPALAAALFLSTDPMLAQAIPASGKLYAKSGDWEIKRFPKGCVASVGFDGDRALRLYSGPDAFSFGFMGAGVGDAPARLSITYWFDKNPKVTRTAIKRVNQAEDGGAPWLIFNDPVNEPSHAGDFELARTVTFSYKIKNVQQTETFQLKGAGGQNGAYAKLFKCSGQ